MVYQNSWNLHFSGDKECQYFYNFLLDILLNTCEFSFGNCLLAHVLNGSFEYFNKLGSF